MNKNGFTLIELLATILILALIMLMAVPNVMSTIDKNKQDTHSGGSGCACIGTVFSGYFFKLLKDKKLNRILLIATGALTNATTSQQGESIPGIAHAVSIEN